MTKHAHQQSARVAIVGAGPAGASLANALLLTGVSDIALIDRARFPRDKSCGDGLGPGVGQVLDRLDLGHVLGGRPRISHMTVNAYAAPSAVLPVSPSDPESPLGWVMTRLAFDHAMQAAAIERGARDLGGWNVASARHANGRWHLSLEEEDADGRIDLAADILIGADGARSKVRRALGQGFNGDAHTAIAIRAYARSAQGVRGGSFFDVRTSLPQPGYAWAFSDDDGRTNIGLGADARYFRSPHEKLETSLARYAETLGGTIASAPADHATAILPFASHMPPLAYPDRNAALIGDAASMINPLTGEGIFYGMYAGALLGERLGAALTGAGSVGEALCGYERAFMSYLKRHLREAYWLRRVLRYRAPMERTFRFAARRPQLMAALVEFMLGPAPPRHPRSLRELLAVAARGR